MSHSIKINNEKETKWPSRPEMNVKAHEENGRLETIALLRVSGSGTHNYESSIGLVEGKEYVVKYKQNGVDAEEKIKAIGMEEGGMQLVGILSDGNIEHPTNNRYQFIDLKDDNLSITSVNSSWYNYQSISNIVLYEKKIIPFATINGAKTLCGISNASPGQIPKISEVSLGGTPTKWDSCDIGYGPDYNFEKITTFTTATPEITINADDNSVFMSLSDCEVYVNLTNGTTESEIKLEVTFKVGSKAWGSTTKNIAQIISLGTIAGGANPVFMGHFYKNKFGVLRVDYSLSPNAGTKSYVSAGATFAKLENQNLIRCEYGMNTDTGNLYTLNKITKIRIFTSGSISKGLVHIIGKNI